MRELFISNKTQTYSKQSPTLSSAPNGGKQAKLARVIETHQFSVELCPNRPLDIGLLFNIQPSFCSVTWLEAGADLSENGALILGKQLIEFGQNVVLHIAGRNLDESQAIEVLKRAKIIGIHSILALQGDESRLIETGEKDNNWDFPHASDFVDFISKRFQTDFRLFVAGYPEKHPRAANITIDVFYLKQKVLKGADSIITQGCFSYESFEQFVKLCKRFSINVPIIAGIFIITSYKMFKTVINFCQVPVPESVLSIVDKNKYFSERIQEYGIFLATSLIKKLLTKNQVKSVHFFTLNNLEIVEKVTSRIWKSYYYLEKPFEISKSFEKNSTLRINKNK